MLVSAVIFVAAFTRPPAPPSVPSADASPSRPTSPAPARLIALPTQPPPPLGTAGPCPDALIEGALVADARWGLALDDGQSGFVRKLLWPYGYTARRDERVVVLDERGRIVAAEGDEVRLGGGEVSPDDAWLICDGIHVVVPAATVTPPPPEASPTAPRTMPPADSVGAAVSVARAFGEAHPDIFGGVRFEREMTRMVVTLTRDSTTAQRREVERLIGSFGRLELARWSLAELQAVQRRMVADAAADDPAFRHVNGIGFSVTLNRIEVTVDPGHVSDVRRILETRYGRGYFLFVAGGGDVPTE
jgi:hypothetical protein